MSPTNDRLQAYVDGALSPGESAAFESALQQDAELSRRVHRLVEQRRLLHERFDGVLMEPIPARMHLKRPPWLDLARAASLVALGVAVGLAIPYARQDSPAPPLAQATSAAPLAMRAARAHLVYASEVRHPVEVDATQQDHLVKWLSKRLGTELKVPVLATEGFELLGGRLLPGPEGPVAQFMYQDGSGKRLTLYVSARSKGEGPTAFRFAQEGSVSVFYWIDGNWGYALSGDIDKPALSRVSTSVYRQLNP
jgi:anti-sigma factor RsiW